MWCRRLACADKMSAPQVYKYLRTAIALTLFLRDKPVISTVFFKLSIISISNFYRNALFGNGTFRGSI